MFGLSPRQGIGLLGGAGGAHDLSDLFQPGVIPGVPEPTTWSLLIGGFGLVGGAMRRRSAGVAVAA